MNITHQVRFALSSQEVFSRNETEFESAAFYNSILGFIEEHEEREEIKDLLRFWNQYVTCVRPSIVAKGLIESRQIFPLYSVAKLPITRKSAVARLRQHMKESGTGRRA